MRTTIMKTTITSRRDRVAARVALGLALALVMGAAGAPDALAGRGGSFARIRSAAEHGNPDAIVAELERAENIPCTTECMTFVRGLLDSDSYYVRDAAAWWFARRPAEKAALAASAAARLTSGDSAAVTSAADTLARVGHPRAVADLGAAVARGGLSSEARAHAVRALGKLHHISANPHLAAAMSDASPEVRREAVLAWPAILRQSGADPVVALVQDGDVSVRRAAAEVVGRYRAAAARGALEALVVGDADAAVRRNAAWALGRIGDGGSRAALETATGDASSLVRMTARAALRELR
ncbi:MAG TPA: HEAT repeat domain-containing protein [Kofleriaceae bacterium]|nr:HEAT repeat domain-containing protein [Kofleriaceae bacterium]